MNNEYFFPSCFFTQQNQWLWLLVLIGQHIKKYSILLNCEISWRSNYLIDLWSRSSRSRIFLKIGFLKNFAIVQHTCFHVNNAKLTVISEIFHIFLSLQNLLTIKYDHWVLLLIISILRGLFRTLPNILYGDGSINLWKKVNKSLRKILKGWWRSYQISQAIKKVEKNYLLP